MSSTPSGCQIVLAEDNPADVGLVRHVLRAHAIDCDLRVMSDGEEVLSFITELDLNTTMRCRDLLLLDLHLPKRDGKEVLEHLRTSETMRAGSGGHLHVVRPGCGLLDCRLGSCAPLFPKTGFARSVHAAGNRYQRGDRHAPSC